MIAQTYKTRPVTIDRTKYNEIRNRFNRESDYFKMLLDVLNQFYPTEYEMLELLAAGEMETFKFYAEGDYSYVKHLIGYGVISEIDGNYDFKIDSIKEYLLRTNTFKMHCATPDEKWATMCTQRGNLEQRLRIMVKKVLRIAYKTEAAAKEEVLIKITNGKRKYAALSYSDLFDSRKCEIYYRTLQDLINANWDYFVDYFGSQDIFLRAMDVINKEGRFDAHATIPSDAEMRVIQGAVDLVSQGVKKFEDE